MTPTAITPTAITPTAAPPGRVLPAGRKAHRHAVFHPLRVAAVDRLTDDAVSITFDVPGELRDEFRFTAGQHLSVRASQVGDDIRRNYSICSPAPDGPLRIGVKQLPGGRFSGFASTRLRPGDLLDVMTPTGSFCPPLHPAQAKRYAAIAAGSGITPVLSILATALETEPHSTAALIYANRRVSTIMFLEELEDLKDRFPERFQLIHVLDEEKTDVAMLSGRLDVDRLSAILDALLPVDDVDAWLLCGPLPMTDWVRDLLLERGASAANVHRELFHVGPIAARRRSPDLADQRTSASPGAEVTVILDGRSVSLVVPRDGDSILENTLRVRPDAPFACKNAVCGTCRARVIDGAVEMDSNYALEPDELARGFVLTCQSHPVTDSVVLDFDQ